MTSQTFYQPLSFFTALCLITSINTSDIVCDPHIQSARPDCDANTGWQCDYEPAFSHRNGDHAFCDFDVISLDSHMNEFLRKCYFKKPCLINTTLSDWTNPSFWTKDNLVAEYGPFKFGVGKSLELVLRAGHGQSEYTLQEYIDYVTNGMNNYTRREPIYIFDRTIWDHEDRRFQQNHFNASNIPFHKFASSKIDYNGQILAVGSTGTGAAFHAHGENWLFLISGRKRWFLYPPNMQLTGGFWPGYSSKDWFEFIYPHLHRTYDYDKNLGLLSRYNLTHEAETISNKPRSDIFYRHIYNKTSGTTERVALTDREGVFLTDFAEMNEQKNYGNSLFKPLECMQSAGQILYLPEFWWHSVLNVGNLVIGAAVQTSRSRTPWMFERDIHDTVRRHVNSGGNPEWSDLEENGQRMEGIHAFQRLMEYGPMSAVHPFFVGFEYYDMGNYEQAIEYLTEAILMDPTYIEAYAYLSRVYSRNKGQNRFYDLSMAEKILRIAYMMNPNNEGIRKELLSVLRKNEKVELVKLVAMGRPLPMEEE